MTDAGLYLPYIYYKVSAERRLLSRLLDAKLRPFSEAGKDIYRTEPDPLRTNADIGRKNLEMAVKAS